MECVRHEVDERGAISGAVGKGQEVILGRRDLDEEIIVLHCFDPSVVEQLFHVGTGTGVAADPSSSGGGQQKI